MDVIQWKTARETTEGLWILARFEAWILVKKGFDSKA
jgi:hypothetical protein